MFRTLDDLKGKDKNKKDDGKKKTESYTGGEKSGLAVESNPADDIIKRAKEDSKEVSGGPGGKPETNCKITLYANGFTMNDGPFRKFDDPVNQQFIASLKDGRVPEELRGKYKEGLNVGLDDRTSEEYKEPPPPKYVEYSGQGTSLGGGPQSTALQRDHNAVVEAIKIDKSKPITRIIIRLHDGKTQETEVNLDTRVSAIFDYVWSLAPVDGEFQLIAGFPPKPLTDVNQTVEEAGLEDSKITQKLL
jgi:UBX domain-containing protein 1